MFLPNTLVKTLGQQSTMKWKLSSTYIKSYINNILSFKVGSIALLRVRTYTQFTFLLFIWFRIPQGMVPIKASRSFLLNYPNKNNSP